MADINRGILGYSGDICWNRRIFLEDSMRFYKVLCPRSSPAPYKVILQLFLKGFILLKMDIMSQTLLSDLRIDTLSPSAPTISAVL